MLILKVWGKNLLEEASTKPDVVRRVPCIGALEDTSTEKYWSKGNYWFTIA